jgi:hypothetical protein
VVNCNFVPSFITELLEPSGVRSFNFFVRGVSPQNHVIAAQVQFSLNTFLAPIVDFNESFAAAAIGPRTLTVEQVTLDQ